MNPEKQDAQSDEIIEQQTESEPETQNTVIDEEKKTGEDEANVLLSDYKTLKNEKDQLQDKVLRVQAEFDNLKKRSVKEKEADRKYRSQELIQEILPVLDNFERALNVETSDDDKSFAEGMNMIYNQLVSALTNEGVEAIESIGQPFDPNVHHAVMQVEDDSYGENIVVEELQKGYMLKDRVIRPAMVKVNQ